jgi:hypothetical protein
MEVGAAPGNTGGDRAHQVHAAGGQTGVVWNMQEGEEVVFRYRDLLGFSDNVRLGTTISLRLSTLLFGRYVYHTARSVGGPALLFLSVKGQVEETQDAVEAFPLERLRPCASMEPRADSCSWERLRPAPHWCKARFASWGFSSYSSEAPSRRGRLHRRDVHHELRCTPFVDPAPYSAERFGKS